MPGVAHESVVEVLQNEPELVVLLLRAAGVRLPSRLTPVIADSNLSVRDPKRIKQYLADNVFVFQGARRRRATAAGWPGPPMPALPATSTTAT
jgi:hypothetical protein